MKSTAACPGATLLQLLAAPAILVRAQYAALNSHDYEKLQI